MHTRAVRVKVLLLRVLCTAHDQVSSCADRTLGTKMTIFILGVSTSGKTTQSKALGIQEPERVAAETPHGRELRALKPWRRGYAGWENDLEQFQTITIKVAHQLIMHGQQAVALHPHDWMAYVEDHPQRLPIVVYLLAHPEFAEERDPEVRDYIEGDKSVLDIVKVVAAKGRWPVIVVGPEVPAAIVTQFLKGLMALKE